MSLELGRSCTCSNYGSIILADYRNHQLHSFCPPYHQLPAATTRPASTLTASTTPLCLFGYSHGLSILPPSLECRYLGHTVFPGIPDTASVRLALTSSRYAYALLFNYAPRSMPRFSHRSLRGRACTHHRSAPPLFLL